VTGPFDQIGRQWSRLKEFFDAPPDADAPPLEICGAVLNELERRVQPVGGGRRVFPYSRVVVRLAPVNADRAALQAAFDRLGDRLLGRLEELQCEAPKAIELRPVFLKRVPDEWPHGRLFVIDCERNAELSAPRPAGRSLQISVVKGAAAGAVYRCSEPAVNVGRMSEATDVLGRVRCNHVAFQDSVDGVTETVGRAHACFRRDETTGEYRIFDDGSHNGTWIVRRGATIFVPPRDPRGVRVESGDEVRLGRALIRIAIEPE
jgi:hypothetical protein